MIVDHVIRSGAVVVAVLAWRVARRRTHHAAVATWLAVAAAADIVRWAMACTILAAQGPYHGAARGAFHVEEALWLVEPVGLAAVAAAGSGGWRRAAHVMACGAILWAGLVATYPAVRGARLGAVYAAVEVACFIVVATATIRQWREQRWPSMTEILVVSAAATRLSLLVAGPFATDGGPFATWWTGGGAQVAGLTFSAVAHAVWLRSVTPR